jgi:hypothetical protein
LAIGERRAHGDRAGNLIRIAEEAEDSMPRPRSTLGEDAAISVSPEPLSDLLKRWPCSLRWLGWRKTDRGAPVVVR